MIVYTRIMLETEKHIDILFQVPVTLISIYM